MKIACLIRPEPPLIYFANRVHEACGIDLVAVSVPSEWTRARSAIGRKGLRAVPRAIRNRVRRRMSRARRTADYERFFGSRWRELATGLPTLEADTINADSVRERLATLRPDLLLVHGTELVKNEIIDTAPLALNLHWGLSPYYRGCFCTEWALLNWDPYNIGVTVHKLARSVDGGDILAQARAEVRPEDTAHSIDMQLTVLGTDLILRAIETLRAGGSLAFARQDPSKGSLYQQKAWREALERHVRALERTGSVAVMLDTPARRERLPIVGE